MVLSGLRTVWRLASWPTRRSPVLVNATTEGVRRLPSLFIITVGFPPSITATTEFVVPRSIPTAFAMTTPSYLKLHPEILFLRLSRTASQPLLGSFLVHTMKFSRCSRGKGREGVFQDPTRICSRR